MHTSMFKPLCVLLLFAAGCGTNLGGEARARNACPTLTDSEFDLFYSFAVFDREIGGSRQASLASIGPACWNSGPLFDRDSECRSCMTAITEGVY